ncbi:helix-turn-helix transcriptional regulator [Anaeromyxobacter dehalogenans]|uniref:Two component transcriptional regulator, LuxR family n=1 Tax=Anaeromyxobacter dehalogenans (strain 2CP-C) TaxID=290397 RepID=Q2IPA0_ANADE|nr:response regulator transcription factor [Anaeromyxobacter dehalogenans]ABC80632.1 two component transcriptional regulator, LuxR family [Anaeromyxobacter dehalogenans 2CP-C]
MEPLRVLVVSADPLARAGLAALLGARPELRLAGEAEPARAQAVAREADAALWDLGAPPAPPTPRGAADGGGAEALAVLAAGLPAVALVAGEAQAGEALRAGARAVLHRGAGAEAIAAALRAAVAGLTALDPELAAALLRAPAAEAGGPLTPREREVLALVAEGLGNKGIAARLGISEHTAKFHVNAILGKLGAGSRAEAIVRAARLGLVVL